MMEQMLQQSDDRRDAVERAMTAAEREGRISTALHELSVSVPEVRVRDLRTGFLVAFSSTRADYEQSLGEFVSDYIVP